MKRVSIYSKGGRFCAASRYRFYAYFDVLFDEVTYRKMFADSVYLKYMPISKQPSYVKALLFVYLYFRVLFQLVSDALRVPDVLVISRRLLNHWFPLSYKFLLLLIKFRGAKLVYDFDDYIIGSEISQGGMNFITKHSEKVIIASSYLLSCVKEEHRNKVVILPTTDREPFLLFNDNVQKKRIETFGKQVRVIWLATSSSLPFVYKIVPAFEQAGEILKNKGKELQLVIVCDAPLNADAHNFVIENIKWEHDVALLELMKAHIGIMPLEDNQSTRGKGGFKLIQYLSCAIPVIGSDVGINSEIVNGTNGKLVSELEISDWREAIVGLGIDAAYWSNCASGALNTWIKDYSFDYNLKQWKEIIETI